ncbi:MAG: O-antigen ligase family protein [Betaproteobacteria bacterium]|nr:O-antigen ligase family protein [Betaproteobacteria bacterium]
MAFPAINQILISLARWCVIALGIAIPLSVALDNLLLFALLVLMLAGSYRAVLHTAVHNPVARASALLFAALLLGVSYGNTPLGEAADILGKYADLAFVPLLMVAGHDATTRRRAMLGFLAVMLVTALLSWLVGLHILPIQSWMWAGCVPDNPAIFRSSITQNILMSYAAYLLFLQVREAGSSKARWLFTGLAIFAGGNVLFMVSGKTGYLILLALLTYFAWITLARRLHLSGRSIGWREGAGTGLLTLAVIFGTYQVSPRLHERVNKMVTEFQAWQPNMHNETSTGERLEFYYNTFAIVKQHPLLGVGTGGFPAAYARQVQGKDVTLTRNPHNEYLLVTVQVGVAGLALLLYLFYTQWRHAVKLPSLFEQDAARGLVLTIALTSLFNSPLHDHTEGLFFAFASALLFAIPGWARRNG